nr:transposon Ty3-I Gag-Pol polyprotein [Ipomoea batatas]GMD47024.1 transposon Ty3-I Gag-Pol polyprotein [Ipomoea batatas]
MMPQVNPPHGNMSSSDSEGDEIPIAYGQQQYRPKVDLPHFNGHLDVEAFLDWIYEVEKCFEMLEVPEDRQAKYVAHKLKGGAAAWWEMTQNNRRRQGKMIISSWRKMKKLMMARFLPPDYQQQLFQKYQRCSQDSRSVNDYTEEFYRLGARCNLSETAEQQTARYIAGLRFNIQERMTLSPIWSVDEAYNMAIKAEALFAQANQRRQYTPALPKTISTIPPQNSTTHQPITQHTQTTEFGHSKTQRQRQEGNFQPQNTTSNPYAKPFVGKCFKCGETGHRSNECRARRSVNLIEENTGEEDGEFHEEDVEVAEEVGEHLSFVVQRLLYTAEDKSHVQRNRIFRAYCNILGKGWIKDGPSVTVSEVCLVPVSIGKSYEDVVACEVIEMDACHILLGKPWQFDVDATHHGRDNTYSFVWKSKKIIIPPAPWAELKIQNTCAVTIRMNPTENDFGPVVYPKQPMPANKFYWLLGVDSRDLKGKHSQKMSLYKERSKPRLSPKGYGYFKGSRVTVKTRTKGSVACLDLRSVGSSGVWNSPASFLLNTFLVIAS